MTWLSAYRGSLLVLATLLLSGCGGSNGNGLNDIPGADADNAPPKVSGNAAKGAIRNAEVSFTPIGDGVLGSTLVTTAVTDVFGDFEAELPSDADGTVLLQVTANPDGQSSSMVCDLPAGCGGGEIFGDVFPLAGDFKLRALLSDFDRDDDDISINIFTELAATLVLDGGGIIDGAAINDARGRVATLFNIDGSLSRIQIRDLSSERFDELEADAQIASLLGVGLMASFSPEPDGSLGFDLEGFRQTFLDAGGTLPVNDEDLADGEAVVTLLDVLSAALALAEDPLIADRLREDVRDRLADRVEAATPAPSSETVETL